MIKKTSFSYGASHQEKMLEYYYRSKQKDKNNTDYLRVVLAGDMVSKIVKDRFLGIDKSKIKIADVGCSIGLMAIEFAKQGFCSSGYDFDPAAIEIAQKLANNEKVNVNFYQRDVSSQEFEKPIDLALCFDIFEHLHDDEIGVLLNNLKKSLSKDGCIIFHTLPGQYDYLFWNDKKGMVKFPLILNLLKKLNQKNFSKAVKIYALIGDVVSIFKDDKSHKDIIKKSGHPNPLTKERLVDIFERAGLKLLLLQSGFLGEKQFAPKDKKYFTQHQITHRSLYGIAVRESENI